jgi:hypothetical protein
MAPIRGYDFGMFRMPYAQADLKVMKSTYSDASSRIVSAWEVGKCIPLL